MYFLVDFLALLVVLLLAIVMLSRLPIDDEDF